MSQAQNKRGCLRPLLIGVITLTSISFAIFYSIFLRGRYNGKDLDYKAIVFENVDLWSGPGRVEEDTRVVFEGQLITCIGNGCEVPQGSKIFEGDGKSLIPGLIDMQLSFYALSSENQEKNPLSTLIDYIRQRPEVRKHLHEAGITTLRSAGDPMNNIRQLKGQVRNWDMAGPRIFAVGPMFTAPGGHPAGSLFKNDEKLKEAYATQVSDSNVARKAVLDVLERNMDGIKLVLDDLGGELPKFKPELAEAMIRQAKKKKAWVSVRTGNNEDIRKAVQMGADIIEYGSREALDSTTIRLMKENEVIYLPILISSEIIPKDFNSDWYNRPFAEENLRKVGEADIPIATGTATGKDISFGASLHQEMELMVQAGLSPEKVLAAATQTPLKLFKKDDQLGQIKEGFTAEAVLVEGKPWENIKDIRKVRAVIQDGRLVVENGKVVD